MTAAAKKAAGRRAAEEAAGEEMVEVFLRRSVGRRGGPLYGPGLTKVPASLAKSLELSPDLIETDGSGNPLPHTTAASALGPRVNATDVPSRRKSTDEDDDEQPVSLVEQRRREIADAAEGERQGGTSRAESGALDDTDAELLPLPGQKEATREQKAQLAREAEIEKARGNGGGSGAGSSAGAGRIPGVESDKPLTKSELRSMDSDVLADLARRNNVSVKGKGGKAPTKGQLVDALNKAQVRLD